ncbi:OB-fold putative lipoprotein [Niabella hibiscisoli]|uniref:OB-fold putative lipoprotein n=1 Tax=Niabella hibiscisoli TaxID=1825928 RepID=UPI001F10735E|nr:OB-fold putative lipoprotein [Niabella hibiscisoli]MCH5719697.1 OB-fold putative lipoprotein [Niabella hibiscisoli]
MNWKKVLVTLFITVLIAAGLALCFYYKKPPDIRKSAAYYETTASALLADFDKDESTANAKYLDKVIVVEGVISKIDADSSNPTVFLETGNPMASVNCSFYETESAALRSLQAGATVKIKGVCTGRLMDIVLNKCSITQ